MTLKRICSGVLFAGLLASLCALRTDAQTSPIQQTLQHYRLIDLGALGGPSSFVTFGGTKTINDRGDVTGTSDTATADPYQPNCLQADCLVNHSFLWHQGLLTDLGALVGPNVNISNSSIPLWINSKSWVVGASENGLVDPLTGFPEMDAVLWRNGQIIDLGTLGGNSSVANSVNNRGQVVGGALNTTLDPFSGGLSFSFIFQTPGFFIFAVATQAHAVLWQNHAIQDLGTLGGPDSVAWYVNDRGQIAGQSTINDTANATTGVPTVDVFLWRDGKMLDLGGLGGTFSWPADLNNKGQVVGASNVPGDLNSHPFLWDGEVLRDLGTFGGDAGVANAINNAEDVVGWAADGNAAVFGFLWHRGVLTNLGTVDGDPCSVANSINEKGQVVGESSPQCFAPRPAPNNHGFLWKSGGPAIDLNTLVNPGTGLQLTCPCSINDRGEIDGTAADAGGNTHATLLIPCDDDHPGIESCDYSSIDASAVALLPPTKTSSAQPTVANPKGPSGLGIPLHLRSLFMNRYRRFGVLAPK
jgi:probable HAF family extracellular repeat protein